MVRHDGGGRSRCRRMRSAISSSLGSALFLLEEAADDRLGGLLHEYQWAA